MKIRRTPIWICAGIVLLWCIAPALAQAEDTFSITVPPDWELRFKRPTLVIYQKETDVYLRVWRMRTELTDVEEAADKVLREWGADVGTFKTIAKHRRELGGVPSVHFHIQEGSTSKTLFSLGDILLRGNVIYVIKCTAPAEKFENYELIFTNILDSVHF